MRPQRLYDPHKPFYALTAFKYAGVNYKRGDKFDAGEMPSRKRIQFFQNHYIGYFEDFRDNRASIQEVKVEPEKPKEEVSDSPVEEKPKPQKSYRKPRASKKKSEDSAGDTVSDTKS